MAKDDFQANWRGARRLQFDEETRRKLEARAEWHPSPERLGPWNAQQYSDRITQFHPTRTVQPHETELASDEARPKPHAIRYLVTIALVVFLVTFGLTHAAACCYLQ